MTNTNTTTIDFGSETLEARYNSIVEDLESFLDLNYVFLEDQQDMERVNIVRKLYSPVILKSLRELLPEMSKLESFYKEFHKDLD